MEDKRLFDIVITTFQDNPSDGVVVMIGNENPRYVKVKKHIHSMEEGNPYFKQIISMWFTLIAILSKEEAETAELYEDEMILCIYCLLDENGDIDMNENLFGKIKPSSNYIFCGYDLTDEGECSILTCYGRVSEHTAFSIYDLNQYGLVNDFKRIKQIQEDVWDEEDFCICYNVIYAIWMRK